jgi:MtrB/PioB family decaheme-associated outer membrane protein
MEIGLIKDSPVEVKLSYFHEKRRGTRGAGTAFGFYNVVETPEPIEYRTQDITLSAELTRSWGLLRGALNYNRFTNGVASVSFDNPFRVTDSTDGRAYLSPSGASIGGAAVGVVGLPPGNDAMTGSLGLLYKLPHHTRFSASAALGQWGQDAAFIPWTSNTAIEEASHALPANSLNGKIKTLAFSGGITSRPASGLGLSARFRHYDLDNQTPRLELHDGYVRFDAVWEEIPRISVPYAYSTDRADLSASYDLGSATIEAGYRYDKFNREYRETKETTQGMLSAGVRFRAKDWAVLRLSGETGSRSFDEYNAVEAEEHSFLEPEDPANLTSLRRYDQANKDMQRLNALVQLTPTGKLGLTLAYQMGTDDFKDSSYGLTKADNSVFSVDADFTPNERANLFAFYSREDISTNQRGRQSGGSLSESELDDWTSDIDTKVDSFGGGAVLTLVENRLKLKLQGNYQKVDGNNAIASPIGGAPQSSRESVGGVAGIPEFNDTELWRALAEAHLRVNASVTLAFGGWLEQYKLRDAFAEGIVNYVPGSFFLAASDADYKGHAVYARAIYTW